MIVPGQTFPRSARLLNAAEFKNVFDRSVVSGDRFFRVFAQINQGPCSRLGMAVSRKVDPRAVVRNRIRRVIRESFRLNHPYGTAHSDRNEAPPRDYVVLASPTCSRAANAELTESLAAHWREIEGKLLAAADSAATRTQ